MEQLPRKGHARHTGPRAGHTTPPFPVLWRGLAHRNCPSLPRKGCPHTRLALQSGEQKPTGPPGGPLTSPGRKPDLETRCGKTLLRFPCPQLSLFFHFPKHPLRAHRARCSMPACCWARCAQASECSCANWNGRAQTAMMHTPCSAGFQGHLM